MNTQKTHIVYIVIIILLIIIATGEFLYFHKKLDSTKIAANKRELGETHSGAPRGMGGMSMTPGKPPTLSDQQTQQLADGTSSATTEKTFNITGGNYYFVPNKITVNKGDKVTFIMTNAGGVHDLVIDELGIKTQIIRTGNAVSATFTATKVGSFVFYCDVPGHKTKGMWGTLVIQ